MSTYLKLIIGSFVLILISGCYPETLDTYEESDIIVTDYNEEYNFSEVNTYFMPDTIHYIGEDNPDRSWDSFVIELLEQNFDNIGYTRLDDYDINNPPDAVVTITVLKELDVDSYSVPFWSGYGPNDWVYNGYNWYYPFFRNINVTTYSVGTLSWVLWDPDNVNHETETIPIEYAAIINGLIGSSKETTQDRISESITIAFSLSSYL